jgi:hypothetical protein
MSDTMVTSGTEMERDINERLWTFEDKFHLSSEVQMSRFKCQTNDKCPKAKNVCHLKFELDLKFEL